MKMSARTWGEAGAVERRMYVCICLSGKEFSAVKRECW